MNDLNIAFIQTDLRWEDKGANLQNFTALLDQVQEGTDLVLLPETFTTAFPVDPRQFAESVDGDTMRWLKEKAREKNAVICGTMLLEMDGVFHNSLVWMRPDGTYELYHKRHPFSIGGENNLVERGEEQLLVELKGWHIRPMVCYDVRFPVWARNRYAEGGYEYDLAFYLANFPDSRMVVWNSLLVARAIENQAYVVGVNRIGDDPNGLHYSGESQAVNARGEVIAKVEPYKEGVAHCVLSAEKLLRFRQKFPLGPDWDAYTVK